MRLSPIKRPFANKLQNATPRASCNHFDHDIIKITTDSNGFLGRACQNHQNRENYSFRKIAYELHNMRAINQPGSCGHGGFNNQFTPSRNVPLNETVCSALKAGNRPQPAVCLKIGHAIRYCTSPTASRVLRDEAPPSSNRVSSGNLDSSSGRLAFPPALVSIKRGGSIALPLTSSRRIARRTLPARRLLHESLRQACTTLLPLSYHRTIVEKGMTA